MLKNRIIAVLVVKRGIVVQSIGFKRYLPVGRPEIAVEFLNSWGIDEIVIIDIDATCAGRAPDYGMIKTVASKSFVPLTVGGGIKAIDEIKRLIRYGADKFSINSAAINNPSLIKEAAEVFGNQCVVVSMDVKKSSNGRYEVFVGSGKTATGLDPVNWAKRSQELGAGEILLNSIDQDGAKNGYDLNLIKLVSEAVNIPVIACGGVGHPDHFVAGMVKGKAAAAAAGNYFHFTEHSPVITKAFLKNNGGLETRIDTYYNYQDFQFDAQGRLAKRTDQYLNKIRFEKFPKEVI